MTENVTYCDKHVSSRKFIFFVVMADSIGDSDVVDDGAPLAGDGGAQG